MAMEKQFTYSNQDILGRACSVKEYVYSASWRHRIHVHCRYLSWDLIENTVHMRCILQNYVRTRRRLEEAQPKLRAANCKTQSKPKSEGHRQLFEAPKNLRSISVQSQLRNEHCLSSPTSYVCKLFRKHSAPHGHEKSIGPQTWTLDLAGMVGTHFLIWAGVAVPHLLIRSYLLLLKHISYIETKCTVWILPQGRAIRSPGARNHGNP